MRGKWVLAAAAVILLGAATGGVVLLLRNSARPSRVLQQEAPKPAPDATLKEISVQGVLRAQAVLGIPAPIQGTLEEVLVSLYEEVHREQVLGHIRNTALEADVRNAQEALKQAEERANRSESMFLAARLEASRAAADLTRAQAEFYKAEKDALRQQVLHREGATPRRVYEQAQKEFREKEKEYDTIRAVAKTSQERSEAAQQDLDRARAAFAQASTDLEAANNDLLATEIVSPVDGVVTAITAAAGAEVHPEAGDLFQIAVDLSRMEVVVEPEPSALERIQPGQPAEVHVAEAPHEAFQGIVKSLDGGKAIVEFASPSALVRPGLSAQVVIRIIR
jgi:multidrug resistance efflux pump